MIEIRIPLQDIIIDVKKGIDLSTISEQEAILHLSQAYQFLPLPLAVVVENDVAIIASAGESSVNKKAARLFDRAIAEANRGRYSQAILLFEQFLQYEPDNVDARRNLGMAFLEMGNIDTAEAQIINTLNLKPDDAYGLLLLGNIYLQHRNREDIAEHFYQKAGQANPDDPYILSNIGSLLAQRKQFEEARVFFDQAIAIDASYPNANYGKGITYYQGRRSRYVH